MIPGDVLARLERALAQALGADSVRRDHPLAALTTLRVGGPADLLVEPVGADALVTVLDRARDAGVPVTMLGGGSNVVIADRGIRGLVVRPRAGAVHAADDTHVRTDAATTVNGLVRWTIGRGFAGLEAWAGTPGTVGGGIYGNAHWGGRLLSEHLESATLWSAAGGSAEVAARALEFGYDRSRLQRTREVLVSACFRLGRGEPEALRAVARASLAYRKRTQPLDAPSAGCIFQNPGESDTVPADIPRSAGALVDRAGLKGTRVGAAVVSPVHANFIVNEGGASAADILELAERCRAAVRDRFGVELRDEIVRLGDFTQ
jgi:UDP-N-acetylmuramate dehydrogenase